jgi:hypothetical protein
MEEEVCVAVDAVWLTGAAMPCAWACEIRLLMQNIPHLKQVYSHFSRSCCDSCCFKMIKDGVGGLDGWSCCLVDSSSAISQIWWFKCKTDAIQDRWWPEEWWLLWPLKHSRQWTEGRVKGCGWFELLDRARGGDMVNIVIDRVACHGNVAEKWKASRPKRRDRGEKRGEGGARESHLNSFLQCHSKSVWNELKRHEKHVAVVS